MPRDALPPAPRPVSALPSRGGATRRASSRGRFLVVAFALTIAASRASAANDPPAPTNGAGATTAAVDDARDLAALASCSPQAPYVVQWNTERALAPYCGQLADRRADLRRTIASARPLDAPTEAHVRALFAEGSRLGRRPHVFGLVGDSTTLEPQFMTPLGEGMPPPSIAPALREALQLDPGPDGAPRSVLEWFRGAPAYGGLDSFRAPRAAKTGARATWPLERDPATGTTPLDALVTALSPAYAIVLFGTNDAELFVEPLDRVAARFARALDALAAALEARGIIPILTTVPKHMRAYGMPDCSAEPAARTNARIMIQTSEVSATVAAVARARHLPLIDYRDALDPLVHHGIAADGVHPGFYAKRLGGGGALDEAGLQCGVNVRTAATLRMLALVRRAIEKG